MKRTTGFAAIAISILLVGIPTASAQVGITNPDTPTDVVLYAHLDGIEDFPINTQIPEDFGGDSVTYGTTTSTASCVDAPAGPFAQEYHTFYGYSSPGYVQYDVIENGKPRYHPERGISYDAKLNGDTIELTWYLETQVPVNGQGAGDPDTLPAGPVVPNVVVRGTMRTGDSVGLGTEHYNVGNIIAQGQSAPVTLAGAGTEGASYGTTEEGKHVYGFTVPLQIQQNFIPRDTGYNLRIDVYVESGVDGCDNPDDGYIMPNTVRIHSSKNFRPTLELQVTNPVRIEYLHPDFIGEDLVIHTAMNSVWGNYDVDERPGGITLDIEGPSPALSLERVAFDQRHAGHNEHQDAVDVSYIWPYKQDNAKDGLYTVTLNVKNDQETATAVGVAQFEIGKGTVRGCGNTDTNTGADVKGNDCIEEKDEDAGPTEEESPGVGLVLMAIGLLGVAFLARRK